MEDSPYRVEQWSGKAPAEENSSEEEEETAGDDGEKEEDDEREKISLILFCIDLSDLAPGNVLIIIERE